MKYFLLSAAFSLFLLTTRGQDTVKVMTYNILNYGNFTSYCTLTNNNPFTKEDHLRTIFSYISPDIAGINEIGGAGNAYAKRLLDSVLNQSFPGRYAMSAFFNTTSSSLVNMLYYDVTKFTMKNQWSLNDGIRDICFFRLYYNSPALLTGDTVFLTCISMHLKAGSTSSDISDRAAETLALMNHINSQNLTGNIMVMGDFNVYSSTEACYQNMLNYTVASRRFYDPVNKSGSWNNNSSYALYHTQSTQTADNGCAATGGLDDRFDFILINENIKYSTSKVSYVNGSYTTSGQDGNHFNQSLSNPANTSAPADVINALQNASDHLPVSLKLRINQLPASGSELTIKEVSPPAYLGNNCWQINGIDPNQSTLVMLYDLTGRTVSQTAISGYSPVFQAPKLNPGLYIINYMTGGLPVSFKVFAE
jgi:hypothetical protein